MMPSNSGLPLDYCATYDDVITYLWYVSVHISEMLRKFVVELVHFSS